MTTGQWRLAGLLVLITLLGLLGAISDHASNQPNLYALQAEAFLEGRVEIDRRQHDVAIIDGRRLVPFPPAPALLLLPIVALAGPAASPIPVALLLTGANLVVLFKILGRLRIDHDLRFWIVVAFTLGTAYWLALQWSNGVWFFAHIVAVTFLLLAVAESLGRGRGWLVGLLLGGAFLSRQLTLLAAIFLLVALWRNERAAETGRRSTTIGAFTAGLALCVAGYLAFNALRFGHPFDTGYTYLALDGFLEARQRQFGLFSPVYLPFNLLYLLFQGFHLSFSSPEMLGGIDIDPFGTSLLAASPFLIVAFYARRERPLVRAAWLAVGLTALPQLFYYNNGWVQPNAQRFSLDYWPILILLVALGLQRQKEAGQARLWKWLIGYAVLLNLLTLLLIPEANDFLAVWTGWFRGE